MTAMTPAKMTRFAVGFAVLIATRRVSVCGQQELSADRTKERAAEAAYMWQRDTPVQLKPEVAELLGHHRFPCFWGEEYTGDLTSGHKGYGYRTCGLRHLHRSGGDKECVVYSFGSDGDYDFERKIASIYGPTCVIHIFDPDTLKGGVEAFEAAFAGLGAVVHYHRMALLDRDEQQYVSTWPHAKGIPMHTKTLPTIMKALGHTHIDVLKIDIEGNEHRALAHLAENGWPSIPGQVYMEVHSRPHFAPYEAVHIRRLIETLEKAGLRLFNAERPWRWCQSSCLQLSFIHRNWSPNTDGYPASKGWLRQAYGCRHESMQVQYQIYWNGTVHTGQEHEMQAPAAPQPLRSPPVVAPGAWFAVTWNILNTGSVPMLEGCCSVVKVGGTAGWRRPSARDALGVLENGDGEVIAGQTVPGQSFLQTMELVAPLAPPGRHSSQWRIRTRAGNFVGAPFEVAVYVASA